jgi:hypothetical protein
VKRDPYRGRLRTDHSYLDKLIDDLITHVTKINKTNSEYKEGEIDGGGK